MLKSWLLKNNLVCLSVFRPVFIALFLSFFSNGACAQTSISAGYLGHFGLQSGVFVRCENGMSPWEKDISKNGPRTSSFYAGVNAGYFARITYNSNLVLGTEVGLIAGKPDKL